MNELRDFQDKAEKFLSTAELAMGNEDYDSCVSRCYYAMFFMAEAALLSKGLKSQSHKGVISLFGEHFVKAGIFSKDLGRGLNDVYDRRLIGDYGVGLSLNKADAASDLAVARNFVSILKGYLEKQTSGKPRP